METDLSASGLSGQRMGGLALAGVVVFATTCIAAQFARSDLDWMRAPLSSLPSRRIWLGRKGRLLRAQRRPGPAGRWGTTAPSRRPHAAAPRCSCLPSPPSRWSSLPGRFGFAIGPQGDGGVRAQPRRRHGIPVRDDSHVAAILAVSRRCAVATSVRRSLHPGDGVLCVAVVACILVGSSPVG